MKRKQCINSKLHFLRALCVGISLFVLGQPTFAVAAKTVTDEQLAKQECSACHYFYAREFLPAFSWKKILNDLPNHFGEDASLDQKSRQRILSYLAGQRSTEIPIRITDLSWWKRAHGSNFKAFAARQNVRASNCGGCHRQ